jgi:putative membrane protein
MQEWMLLNYDWLRTAHIVAVMSWMAGMLYLPRLYVYHAGVEQGSDSSELFKIMERRLLRFIMNPAMILSWVFGLAMLHTNPAMLEDSWMHVKLGAIVILTCVHGLYARWRKVFERDANLRPAGFYRWWNEAPTVLMIIIVVMAVAQPF